MGEVEKWSEQREEEDGVMKTRSTREKWVLERKMEIEMDIGLKKNKRESRVDTGIRMIGKCEDNCRN